MILRRARLVYTRHRNSVICTSQLTSLADRRQVSARAYGVMSNIPPVAGDHLEFSSIGVSNHGVRGLPKAGQSSKSYWLETVAGDPLLNYRSSETLPEDVEVVIIGSGMTGVSAAHALLSSPSPPASVLMLEAREFCSGATGRNAGHCKPDQWRGFVKYSKTFGKEQAFKILRNERETHRRLVEFIKNEGVDCDLWTGRTMDVITTEELAGEAAKLLDEYASAGGDVDHLAAIKDPVEAERVSKVRGAKMIISWEASTLSPWKLVAHIAKKCLSTGLNLQTRTTVTSVSPSSLADGGWQISTSRGKVRAKTVIHATNAYASALLDEVVDVIKPTPHMCNAVIPPSSARRGGEGAEGLGSSYSVMYPHGIHTINPRIGGDGVHLISAAPNNPSLVTYLAEDPRRLVDDGLENYGPINEVVKDFTQKAFGWNPDGDNGAKYFYSWSGIIGRSGDMVPLVGAVPGQPGQWICAGHNAHGMSRIFTAAPGLVRLIQGGSWAETGLPECFEITAERLERLQKASTEVSMGPKKAYHPLR